MTDDSIPDGLPDRAVPVLDALKEGPGTKDELADRTGLAPVTVTDYIKDELRPAGITVDVDHSDYRYHLGGVDEATDTDTDDAENTPPDHEDLTPREAYIYRSLPSSTETLAEDLDISERAVDAHLSAIEAKGWPLEADDAGNYLGPDQDHLRSSEHKQTRTRKANRWWQRRHDQLVHDFQELEWPRTSFDAECGNEDWVTHLTDVHAGDRIRRDDGRVVYETETIPPIIDYVTQKSLTLADVHGATYDAAHLLWGGDMITNEGIYEGQFEDLDAWLDEQHDIIVDPLIRQVKAFARRFPSVQVVCQVGNHGQHRASGTSRQANADLILYKTVRNVVAAIREHTEDGLLDNVEFRIGEAQNYRNFEMRDGAITGHLRHGQDRRPQAETSARQNEWRGTLMDHDFDVAYAGHHHISGRVPWDGPPIFFSGSPKPAGEFVESLGGRTATDNRDIATCHGVDEAGVTNVFPIDTRDFEETAHTSTSRFDLDAWEWGGDR